MWKYSFLFEQQSQSLQNSDDGGEEGYLGTGQMEGRLQQLIYIYYPKCFNTKLVTKSAGVPFKDQIQHQGKFKKMEEECSWDRSFLLTSN